MILILADGTDPWSSIIHRELNCRGLDVLWVQSGELLDRIAVNWSMESSGSVYGGSLMIDGRCIAFDDLTGVLVRLAIPPPLLLDDLSPEDRHYITRETTAAWLALLDALPCSVVNRPVPGGRPTLSSCSVDLSSAVLRHGFLVPPAACGWSRSRHDPLSNRDVYVKQLGSQEPGSFLGGSGDQIDHQLLAEGVAWLQQLVPEGQRVTVYIAAEQAVGTVIQSGGHLPDQSISSSFPTERCASLAQSLGLDFAECQLVVAPEGVYCIDISPSPQYWRCPQEIQRQITTALADYLLQPRSISLHDSVAGAHGRFGAC